MSSNSLGLSADLTGQIALVTGASQGLGQTVAVRLGENGAKVLCVARNADKLAETVAQIQAAGGEAELLAPEAEIVVQHQVHAFDRFDAGQELPRLLLHLRQTVVIERVEIIKPAQD